MKIFSENENYKLYQGNMLDMLEVIEPETIDSIVTDPPYGLTSITKRFGKENSAPAQFGTDGAFSRLSKGFMGKEWDGSGIEYNIDAWQKCYEVLKPGGYLLAFGGSRTFHRIACAIEDAGFEIRDTIMWLYGSGFPKSMDISKQLDKRNGKQDEDFTNLAKQWQGWGTCLKPSFEPIIVARKPFKGSLVDNVIEYGVGGLNIDECRVAFNGDKWANQKSGSTAKAFNLNEQQRQAGTGVLAGYECKANDNGRFPANTILTYDETDFDEVCGGFPNTKSTPRTATKGGTGGIGQVTNFQRGSETSPYNDSGSASRYFYCAKASKKDRDEGLDEFEDTILDIGDERPSGGSWERRTGKKPLPRKNIHPTVKPTELMQYLVRLVTPNGGIVLDPFNGSGSTGKAVMYENKERNKNYKYIGIELTEEYLPIAQARIEYVYNLPEEKDSQLTIFDVVKENE